MGRRNPLAAALIALLAVLGSVDASAAEPVVLQLPYPPQFRFAGYFAALWQGFYRDAGIEVEIKEGAPPGVAPTDPVREVAEAHARFGVADAALLIRTAQGLPLLLLAPIFQRSGAAVYCRADGDFASPDPLDRGRIGRLRAGDALDLEFRTMLHGAGSMRIS